MKSVWRLIIIGVVALFASKSAYAHPCEAKFTYAIVHEVSELTINFQNESQAADSIIEFKWDFGDGHFSLRENPEHQYLQEGEYIVYFYIRTKSGCISEFTDTLQLKGPPPSTCQASGSYILDTSATYTYLFMDHSSVGDSTDHIVSWEWNFGDGSPIETVPNPTHTFPGPGQYFITLTIQTLKGCSNIAYLNLHIAGAPPPCMANFTSNVSSSNALSVHFHDESISVSGGAITHWEWTFGDADTVNVQDVTHTFPHAGIYDITLRIETTTCKDSVTVQKVVGNPQYYNMWGHVYAGPYPIDKCIAYLYKNFQNKLYVPIDTVQLTSVNDTLGVYYFYQKMEGEHIVKLLLPDNSQFAEEYIPTYYGNEIYWENAQNLSLFADISQAHIHLKKEVMTGQTTTAGYISGNVVSSHHTFTNEGVEILLHTTSGSIVESTFSNSNGEFNFEGIPYGDYYISSDITGLNRLPVGLQLSATQDTVSGIELFLRNSIVMGINDTKPAPQKIDLTVFPNPARTHISLQVDHSNTYQIIAFDMMGKAHPLHQSLWMNRGATQSISVENLPKGVYILRLQSIDKLFIASKKLIIK